MIVILVAVGTIFAVDSQLAVTVLDMISVGVACLEIARCETATQLRTE
ncbi:hypothetical protein GCM10009555_041420 [Acrocarpospora macrocephala]|uniref:Uncharacterized protein n=1 Tax=Acrocarpospora macrocephala TaxID=150177 RepID=A0A5M3WMM0_9ACTN|nr:hypothetical protein [Acrocarpospora macrocephala]GES09886.1 hypothetical protein Amac_034820 [Acrocarpospora macrocephala]